MKTWFSIPALALSVMSLTALADETKTFSENYEFDAHGNVAIDNINGDITISGWDKDEISLEYTVTADDEDDLENVNVDVAHSERELDIEVDIESGGFMSWGGSSGEVDFELKVPYGVSLRTIESVNGDIEISAVRGEMKVSTVNGRIVVQKAANNVKFDTVNGDVEVSLEELSSSTRIKGDSVNGDIEIYLPENDGFELKTDTVNGSLSNDFGIKVEEGDYVGADMEGEYKSGGASLKFDTVNGDIEVRKR
ncbi:DUF4097 family beta strand repeat-containing protein [Kangiella shandongensis]|uniref:DUF4097 family beta strand repeat-containing protein n=1 Tax=Kangiella shandongensis TaxID=2763258 RepID=UPI001CBDF78B|nr:DUF4097 family beta strand repeat-containing protein [Kangiella shandongensis]